MKKILSRLFLLVVCGCVSPAGAAIQVPDTLPRAASTAQSRQPRVATDSQGYVYSLWLDDRNQSTNGDNLFVNVSPDHGQTWRAQDIALGNTGWNLIENNHRIKVDGLGHVYVTWLEQTETQVNMMLAQSADHGQTWSAHQLNTGIYGINAYDFSFDRKGNVCVVWEGQDVTLNCSHDFGSTWSAQETVWATVSPAPIINRQPSITNDEEGNFYIAWSDGRNRINLEVYLFLRQSSDAGRTWGDERPMTAGPGSATYAYSSHLYTDPQGNIFLLWKHYEHWYQHNFHLRYAKSLDQGKTWSGGGLAQYADSPQMAFGANGLVYVAWADIENASYHKLKFRRSQDYGANWDPAEVISGGTDMEKANFVLASSNEQVYALWEHNETWQGIFMVNSKERGAGWSAPIRVDNNFENEIKTGYPDLAVDRYIDRVYASWQDDRSGREETYMDISDFYRDRGTFQDFEADNGSDQYGWAFNNATVSRSSEKAHSGQFSWKIVAPQQWGGTGLQSQAQRWDMDFYPDGFDRLSFWIYALPAQQGDNNVAVKFFDNNIYAANGFEVWTTQTARYNTWTSLKVLFSQLPGDFDLNHVNKIEMVNYQPGVYYVDDIKVTIEDRSYQAFEPGLRSGAPLSEFGWSWSSADTVGFSAGEEPLVAGEHSWKMVLTDFWRGSGLVSQEKKYLSLGGGAHEQTLWHVDIDPRHNDRLSFWVYALPETGLDSNLAIQLFDYNDAGQPSTEPLVIWTQKTAQNGVWSKFVLTFSDIQEAFAKVSMPGNTVFDLDDLNKLQIQVYWPGTYFIDEIRATASSPEFDNSSTSLGKVQWGPVPGVSFYRLQVSSQGPNGPWEDLYAGPLTEFQYNGLSRAWLRVRAEAPSRPLVLDAYVSDWSPSTEYNPAPVLIKTDRLRENAIEVTEIPQAREYEVQSAPALIGPWVGVYTGKAIILPAVQGYFYRVRAVRRQEDTILEASRWSPVQSYTPGAGYVKANGLVLKDADGTGNTLALRGVNLGSYLLMEPWMTGIGQSDTPVVKDDWSIREILRQRFGASGEQELMETFADAYIQEADLNALYDAGVNLVRLPLYYRNFQDDNGNWLGDFSQIFSRLDKLITDCADRGIFVLLDLHGAPGGQNAEFHSGRAGFNKLFAPGSEGDLYRSRTVALWQVLAGRYKDNPAVLGYDLLNEPTGFQAYYPDVTVGRQVLWQFYDVLYDAIRAVDTKHVIMMEAVWDWEALPSPQTFGWQNVVYQFHYYMFTQDAEGNITGVQEAAQAHKNFIDQNVTSTRAYQALYQIPVMVGEFNAFNYRQNWEYYLDVFNRENWLWTMWSYKVHDTSSQWGLWTHTGYKGAAPLLRTDSMATLKEKFARYATAGFHERNQSLMSLLAAHTAGALPNNTAPVVFVPESRRGRPHAVISFPVTSFDADHDAVTLSASLPNGAPLNTMGANFTDNGDGTGTFTWVPGSERIGQVVPITFTVQDGKGGVYSRMTDVIVTENHAPLLASIGSRVIKEDTLLEFSLMAVDEDNDTLSFSYTLPPGAVVVDGENSEGRLSKIFRWTPALGQAGAYPFTITVSDGEMASSESIVIDVKVNGARVIWKNLAGVVLEGNDLVKTAEIGWNAGGASQQMIAGDGEISFQIAKANRGNTIAVGLSTLDLNHDVGTINYGFWLTDRNRIWVVENGNRVGDFGGFGEGDRFAVRRIGSSVQYIKGDEVIYVSSVPSVGYLLFDGSLLYPGNVISDARILGGEVVEDGIQFIRWTSLAGVNANANSLTKTAASGWGNAGAVSAQTFVGDGGLRFTAGETNRSRMAGLSAENVNDTYSSINYAFYLRYDKGLYIYEKGANRGQFGTYESGDELSVIREENQIKYFKNNTLLYTSAVGFDAQVPLMADTAFSTVGATINKALLVGVTPGVPSVPRIPGAVAGDGSVSLKWQPSANNSLDITHYEVRYNVLGESEIFTQNSSDPAGTLVSGLTNGLSYQFRVAAINILGYSGFTDDVTVTPARVDNIMWTDTLGVSVITNSLTKTEIAGWGNAGAASTLSFSGNGGVRFTAVETNKARMFGLSPVNSDAGYKTIAYALYARSDKTLYVYENGVSRGQVGTYAAGDVLSVERLGSAIVYRNSGVTLYTSTIAVSPTQSLLADGALHSSGATIVNAQFTGMTPKPPAVPVLGSVAADGHVLLNWAAVGNNGSLITGYIVQYGTVASGNFAMTFNDDALPGAKITGLTNGVEYQFRVIARNAAGLSAASNIVRALPAAVSNVVWTDAVGVTVNGASITKTADNGWGNAGAASTGTFTGNGGMRFTALATNTSRMAGLSTVNTSASYTTIHYAFYVRSNKTLYVYEKGANRGPVGVYQSGDVLSVERVGNVILYKKNGEWLYTSAVSSANNTPLLIDAALYTKGAEISNVTLMQGS